MKSEQVAGFVSESMAGFIGIRILHATLLQISSEADMLTTSDLAIREQDYCHFSLMSSANTLVLLGAWSQSLLQQHCDWLHFLGELPDTIPGSSKIGRKLGADRFGIGRRGNRSH